MSEFANNIEKLIGQNRVEVAIEEFQKLLTEFKPTSDSGHAEERELKTFFIGLSQRLYQAKDNLKNGNITEQDLARERQKISNQMLETVFDLDKNKEFNAFINTKEEEFAWQNAKSLNTIAAYEEYFRMFPNQKYVQEPPRFLEELKIELRQKAEQERKGRSQEERKPEQKFAASSSRGSSEPAPVKKSNSRMILIGVVAVVIVLIIWLVWPKGDRSASEATTTDSTAVDGTNDNSGAVTEPNNSGDQNNSVQQDNSNEQGNSGNESGSNSHAGGDQNNSNDQSGGEVDSTQGQ